MVLDRDACCSSNLLGRAAGADRHGRPSHGSNMLPMLYSFAGGPVQVIQAEFCFPVPEQRHFNSTEEPELNLGMTVFIFFLPAVA